MQVSTYSYKSYHYFAVRLKKIMPDLVFGVQTSTKSALDFLKNQKDIDYWIFEKDPSFFADKVTKYQGLHDFEQLLRHKSLWRVVATDRMLGRAYLYGTEGYEFKQKSNRNYILKAFSAKLKWFEALFQEFSPDIFMPAMAMSDVGVTIIKQLCDKYDVIYAVPDSLRVQNYCCFTNTPQIVFPIIDETYQKLLNDHNSIDLNPAIKLYNQMTSEFDAPSYFDAVNEKMKKIDFTFAIKIKKILVLIYNLTKLLLSGEIFHDKYKGYQEMRNYILLTLQHLRFSGSRFGTILKQDQKYLYYPLHLNPEYSTLNQGTMFGNQLTVIEALAKSIPVDWVVYVKEHPAMVKEIVRSKYFYYRIRELPNVEIAPTYANTDTLISNAEMVVVINGTSGWEAILRGKPVVTLSDYMFNVMGLSSKCTDLEKLSIKIHDEVNRAKKINIKERKRRILIFLLAVIECGFWISHPNEFFYIQPGTDEEYQLCGEELASGFVKYLNYLQKEKGYSFGIPQET